MPFLHITRLRGSLYKRRSAFDQRNWQHYAELLVERPSKLSILGSGENDLTPPYFDTKAIAEAGRFVLHVDDAGESGSTKHSSPVGRKHCQTGHLLIELHLLWLRRLSSVARAAVL